MPDRRKFSAYTTPFVVAVLLFALGLFGVPKFWIYPIQTIASGALLIFFWRDYQLQEPARLVFVIAIGVAVFILWVAPPLQFLAFARGAGEFNPDVFAASPAWYWGQVIFRFLRLVLVVPLIEEIFWRGFLLRYLINEDFERVSFGSFSWLSFAIVAAVFGFSHSVADWPAALVTGAIYNGVAYRTKSLSSCVLTHALTNLLLGLWIMKTKQWGFW